MVLLVLEDTVELVRRRSARDAVVPSPIDPLPLVGEWVRREEQSFDRE